MATLWTILGSILIFVGIALGLTAAVGLVRPSTLATDDQPNPTRKGNALPALVVALFALGGGAALLPGGSGGDSTGSTTASTEDPEVAAEAALRDAAGWGSSYEIGEVRSTQQVGNEMLGQVFVDLGPAGSQADAVRTWGQAVKGIMAEAGEPALGYYDRVLFYLRPETRGGGHSLAAKATWTTADARDLLDRPNELPYQAWIDKIHEVELKPMGRRSAAAWCAENRADAPRFCRASR